MIVEGLCAKYHCTPSELLAEDPWWIRRFIKINQAEADKNKLDSARTERERASIKSKIGKGSGKRAHYG